MRTTIAIIVGTLLGAGLVLGLQYVASLVFSPPEAVDLSDPNQRAEYIDMLPIGALVAIVVAWFVGALAGGSVAGRIARRQWQPASATVGAFLLILTAITLLQLPHPLWMWIVGVVLPMPTAWFGAHLSHNLVETSSRW